MLPGASWGWVRQRACTPLHRPSPTPTVLPLPPCARTHPFTQPLAADHAEEGSRGPTSDSPVSDVYAPAYNASIFTLSIRSVYRRDFVVDFTRIEGLPVRAGAGERMGGGGVLWRK